MRVAASTGATAARWSDGTARYALDGVGMPDGLMAGAIAVPLDCDLGVGEIHAFVEDRVPPGWFVPATVGERQMRGPESHVEFRACRSDA